MNLRWILFYKILRIIPRHFRNKIKAFLLLIRSNKIIISFTLWNEKKMIFSSKGIWPKLFGTEGLIFLKKKFSWKMTPSLHLFFKTSKGCSVSKAEIQLAMNNKIVLILDKEFPKRFLYPKDTLELIIKLEEVWNEK